jgi:hypothetical protein
VIVGLVSGLLTGLRSLVARRPGVTGVLSRSDLLEVCCRCGGDMVVPVLWEEHGERAWWMRLRCGECGHVRDAVVGDAQADAFAAALTRQARPLRAALGQLESECMADELDRLRAALDRDLIDASDFDR